jgi:hypothetical protein
MTKLLKTGMLMTAFAALGGCMMGHGTKYSQQYYWKHAQVISPVVVPSDIRVKPALGMYPAPHVDVSGTNAQPSLVPPGSKIEYYQNVKPKRRGWF